jgi:hypothetical protein
MAVSSLRFGIADRGRSDPFQVRELVSKVGNRCYGSENVKHTVTFVMIWTKARPYGLKRGDHA